MISNTHKDNFRKVYEAWSHLSEQIENAKMHAQLTGEVELVEDYAELENDSNSMMDTFPGIAFAHNLG